MGRDRNEEEGKRREGVEESVRERKREIGKQGREEDVTHVKKITDPFPFPHCKQQKAGQSLGARLWCAHV